LQPRNTFLGSKYTKMPLPPGLGCKRIFGVFIAKGTCLVAANAFSLHWGANSAPQIS